MCVDSLLLKFNSDKKKLNRLFISVFASDCILSPTNNMVAGRGRLVGGGLCVNNHQSLA